MRKAVIAGNWKMNMNETEAAALASGLVKEAGSLTDRIVLLCPPFTSLKTVHDIIKGSNIKLGAQTMHWEKSGAFTGMISADMLKSVGCEYVIIGHSEQPQFFGETDETVNKRVKAALANGLLPIVCVGELLEERKAGRAEEVVRKQFENGLKGLSAEEMTKVIIAYEPVWAIGTGMTATPKDANDMHKFIRSLAAKIFGQKTADGLVIQYGGSVKPDNIDELMAMEHLDGALVGGASLKVDSFARIIKFTT
jgi:triosephosphate isomerase (TIM)